MLKAIDNSMVPKLCQRSTEIITVSMMSRLLEHEALWIPHCHVEVFIGSSKLTANSQALTVTDQSKMNVKF